MQDISSNELSTKLVCKFFQIEFLDTYFRLKLLAASLPVQILKLDQGKENGEILLVGRHTARVTILIHTYNFVMSVCVSVCPLVCHSHLTRRLRVMYD